MAYSLARRARWHDTITKLGLAVAGDGRAAPGGSRDPTGGRVQGVTEGAEMSKRREAVRSVLAMTGLTELRWRTLGRGLYCFNYHRIGDAAASAFDRGVFSCSAGRFREHVALFKDRFEVIELARLLKVFDGRPPRRPMVLITFDDGYADNHAFAFPVLKEFGVTAAFFIPTAFVGGSRLPWWDEIAWSLRNASTDRDPLEGVRRGFRPGGRRRSSGRSARSCIWSRPATRSRWTSRSRR